MQKEHILATAEKIFFLKSYKEVKLDLIAHELNIQKPSLYHYFKNKKDILQKTVEYSKKKFVLALDQVIKSWDLKAFILRYINFPLSTNNLFWIIYQKDRCKDEQIRRSVFLGKQQILKTTQQFLSQKNMSEIKIYLFLNLLEKLAQNNCIDKYCLKYDINKIIDEIINSIS